MVAGRGYQGKEEEMHETNVREHPPQLRFHPATPRPRPAVAAAGRARRGMRAPVGRSLSPPRWLAPAPPRGPTSSPPPARVVAVPLPHARPLAPRPRGAGSRSTAPHRAAPRRAAPRRPALRRPASRCRPAATAYIWFFGQSRAIDLVASELSCPTTVTAVQRPAAA